MKQILKLSFLFFVFFNINAQTNSAIVTYKKTKTKKTFTDEKKKKIGKKKFDRFAALEKEAEKVSNSLSFTLKYNANKAVFKVNSFMDTPNNRLKNLALLPFGKGVYYNSKTERIKVVETFGDIFSVKYPVDYTKWTLSKESKKIGKYLAYKATAVEKIKTDNGFINYKITAWYTPEINIQYGPIGYSNLPGLILELKKNKIVYYVTNIEFNPKKFVKVNKPKKGKSITLEAFRDLAIDATKKYRKIRG